MTNDRNEMDDDTEGHAARFRGFQPPEGAEGRDDTEGQAASRKLVGPADDEDDTEGQAFRKTVEPAGEEDDVEGHLRLTDEQLASGSSPSQVLEVERRQGGQRDNPARPPRR